MAPVKIFTEAAASVASTVATALVMEHGKADPCHRIYLQDILEKRLALLLILA